MYENLLLKTTNTKLKSVMGFWFRVSRFRKKSSLISGNVTVGGKTCNEKPFSVHAEIHFSVLFFHLNQKFLYKLGGVKMACWTMPTWKTKSLVMVSESRHWPLDTHRQPYHTLLGWNCAEPLIKRAVRTCTLIWVKCKYRRWGERTSERERITIPGEFTLSICPSPRVSVFL